MLAMPELPCRFRRFGVLVAVTALLFCAGCASGKREPEEWSRAAFDVPSEQLFWEVVVEALQKEDFPVGSGLDPSTRIAASGWRTDLAPFRGDGYRERATVHLVPRGSGSFEVRVRVEREVNMDIVRPLDPSYAKWEGRPDDEERERLILQTIRSQLWVGLGSDARLE